MPSQNPPQTKYSILLLTYNRFDLLEARIEEIERVFKDRSDIEIRIFDNGSEDSTGLFLATRGMTWSITTGHPGLQWSVEGMTENIGFGPAFNMLSKRAKGDILFFVSNDVKIRGDFIDRVVKNIENNHHSLVCHELHNGPTGWNQFGGQMIPYPAGHFFACTKELWKEIGGFDERYVPHDFEDVDLGMKCRKLEIPMIGMPQLPIEHMVAGTIGYSPERMENTVLQRKRFAEKWGLPNVPERP